ncbi:FISUMP domain-containing protein [Bacteroidota bacterium]
MTKRKMFTILIVVLLISIFACKKDNSLPNASVSVFPTTGDTTTVFLFDASQSYDVECLPFALKVRWDWNNDGVWDTDYSAQKKNAYRFPDPGNYTIKIQIIDIDGGTDTDQVELSTRGKNKVYSMTDPRDQQVYSIVEINGKWWMADNLNFGEIIADSVLPDNNGIVQKYFYNNIENINEEGGSYTYYIWNEIMGYPPNVNLKNKVCPPGWHIPGSSEWIELFNAYPLEFIIPHFSIGGLSSLSLTRTEYLKINEVNFPDLNEFSKGIFWTSDFYECDTCYLKYNPIVASFTEWTTQYNTLIGLYPVMKKGFLPGLYTYYRNHFNNIACPVRCVKD